MLRVKELLNQKDNKLFYIPPQMSVRSAVDLLVDKNVGALPVMNEDGLLGIFSERDFTRYLVEQGEAILEMPVSDFMTPQCRFGVGRYTTGRMYADDDRA